MLENLPGVPKALYACVYREAQTVGEQKHTVRDRDRPGKRAGEKARVLLP